MTSAYEGMPYVLIEALHAGLPLVDRSDRGASRSWSGMARTASSRRRGAAVNTLVGHISALAARPGAPGPPWARRAWR